jgi:Mg2+ and Co2+ transporter CorA
MTNNDVSSISKNPTTMALPMAQIICAEWLTISRYITTRLSQIEWELEEPKFRKHPKGIDFSFTKLQSWRRTIPLYKDMCVGGKSNFFRNVSHDDSASDLHEDYEAVQAMLKQLERRIERIAAIATAIISIEESRRGIDENRSLGRLTYLVVIFAPLSFVSSLFSMNSDLKSLKLTFWIYFCVSFPFSLAVFTIIGFANLQQWYHKAVNRNKDKN